MSCLCTDIWHAPLILQSSTAEFLRLNEGHAFKTQYFPSESLRKSCSWTCLHLQYETSLNTNATLTNREVSNSSADPANKAKLILLLGGFNNTGELESQLKRISMLPISSEPLHALMIIECHQHSYTVQWTGFDMRTHTPTGTHAKNMCKNASFKSKKDKM